jgi:hypothetical protein
MSIKTLAEELRRKEPEIEARGREVEAEREVAKMVYELEKSEEIVKGIRGVREVPTLIAYFYQLKTLKGHLKKLKEYMGWLGRRLGKKLRQYGVRIRPGDLRDAEKNISEGFKLVGYASKLLEPQLREYKGIVSEVLGLALR